jgi:radical SAM protein with 4Fe4S-binding SPASM domain
VITTLSRANHPELPALRDQLAARGGLVWQIQAANGTGDRFLQELMLQPAELLAAARFIEATRRELAADQLAVAAGHNIGHHACSVHDYSARGTWRGCPGGVTAIGVASDGGVKGCLSMRPSETVGNVRERSLVSIWRDPESFARARWFRPGLLRGGCARCPHGATCRAGCPEMARTATGDAWDNPLCLRQIEEHEAAPGGLDPPVARPAGDP